MRCNALIVRTQATQQTNSPDKRGRTCSGRTAAIELPTVPRSAAPLSPLARYRIAQVGIALLNAADKWSATDSGYCFSLRKTFTGKHQSQFFEPICKRELETRFSLLRRRCRCLCGASSASASALCSALVSALCSAFGSVLHSPLLHCSRLCLISAFLSSSETPTPPTLL